MARSRILQSSRVLTRAVRTSGSYRPALQATSILASSAANSIKQSQSRAFSTYKFLRAPETSPESTQAQSPKPVELTDGRYHELADQWLEHALERFEEIQDLSDEVDVEYSSGVMTVKVPEKGTYVLNKQPPNKQIWLSSPLSGPKRYDYCIWGDAADTGAWVYARDNSTLDQLIHEELGIDLREEQ